MQFGVKASSFPNNSWMNVTESVTTGKGGKGGMAFDPLTAGLGLASAGIGALTGMGAARTQASIAQAQLNAASDAQKWNILQGRDIAKFGEGGNIGARVSQGTYLPDLDFERQKEAAMFEAGPLAERRLAVETDRMRRGFGLANSAEAKEISQRENRNALKRSLAERQGQMIGMFGRIAPINVDTLFT
jgi:hypothetical protein